MTIMYTGAVTSTLMLMVGLVTVVIIGLTICHSWDKSHKTTPGYKTI